MTRSSGIARSRPRRGRVLVVGRSATLDQVCRLLVRPPIEAANLFDAIGELTVATAGEPITAVLVSSEVAHAVTGRAVAALRRVDPSVAVVLVAETEEQLGGVADEGFDECLVGPVDGDALARVIDAEIRALEPAAPESMSTSSTPARPAPPGETIPTPTPTPPAPRDATTRPSGAARSEILAALGELPAGVTPGPLIAPPAAPGDAAEDLGDTDLVEALLHDPTGLRETAMTLARRQSGLEMTFVEDATPPPDADARAAEVCYGGHRYGELRCARATAAQLQPWADWMARWLALDRSYREFRLLAYRDDLTGAWNRRFFSAFLAESIEQASRRREPVTVMVFDLDDFKRYNDEYGHEAGDVILYETVRLLNSVIRRGDRVCRIGGDEFAVIFADPEGPRELGSRHPESVEQIAKRFQDQISTMRFPKLGIDAPGRLSISGGLATYPWDGADADALLRHADSLAMLSKRSGKNVITFGSG